LQRLGYLDYNPSFNPYTGTSITIHNLQEGSKSKFEESEAPNSKNEQVDKHTASKIKQATPLPCLKNEQASEQASEQPYIYNNKTNTNNINLDIEPEFKFFDTNSLLKKEKSSAKKEKEKMVTSSVSSKSVPMDEKPTLELVKEYFKSQDNSEFEAERYFNYYSSNGWLIGGKSKMKDWKASARNWMLNTTKFNVNTPQNTLLKEQTRAQNLHTVTDKNYAEPL
jgi:hypothetical protein